MSEFKLVFCTPKIVSKTHMMIDKLLTEVTSRTLIQTIVNLFQHGSIADRLTFSLARQFYEVLANTLDLQYRNILLATLTNAKMQAVILNNWPFFSNYTDLVKECLENSSCDVFQDIYENIGKVISFYFF